MLRLRQTSARGSFVLAIRTYSPIFRHGLHHLSSNNNTNGGNTRNLELFPNRTAIHSPNENCISSSNRNTGIISTRGVLDVTMPNFRGRTSVFPPSCFKRNMSTSSAAGGVGGASGSTASKAVQDAASSATASSVPDPTVLADAATAASGAADQV